MMFSQVPAEGGDQGTPTRPPVVPNSEGLPTGKIKIMLCEEKYIFQTKAVYGFPQVGPFKWLPMGACSSLTTISVLQPG